MSKFTEWLYKGNRDVDSDALISNWSPHNVKTVIVGGDMILVEYFVPYNNIRYEIYNMQDILVDIKALEKQDPVRSVLRALVVDRVFNDVEEIIVTSDKYQVKELYKIDIDFSEIILGTGLQETFPRLYAVATTNVTMMTFIDLMHQTGVDAHIHYCDILQSFVEKQGENSNINLNVTYFNKMYYYKPQMLEAKYYTLDDAELKQYFEDVAFAMAGQISYSEVIVEEEAETMFMNITPLSKLNLPVIKKPKCVSVSLQFMRSDLFNPKTSSGKVRVFLHESMLDEIERYFKILSSITSIKISSSNQLYLNNILINPTMGYNTLMSLPDSIFKALLCKDKDAFNEIVLNRFSRLPTHDADIAMFEEWLETQNLCWANIFNFKDLEYFENLKTLIIRNPYRVDSIKNEIGVSTWAELYSKYVKLCEDGIYIDGMYVTYQTEPNFRNLEKALKVLDDNVAMYNTKDYAIIYNFRAYSESGIAKVSEKILGKNTSRKMMDKLANIGAKATTLYRNFDVD
jgi:hypothetical protein